MQSQKSQKHGTGRLALLTPAELAEMLVLRVMEETMIKRGITGELSMTLGDNVLVNRFIEAIGAERYKTYRIYSRSIARI